MGRRFANPAARTSAGAYLRSLLSRVERDLRPWTAGVSAANVAEPDPDGGWRLPEACPFTVGFSPEGIRGSGRARVRWLAAQTTAAADNVVEPRRENSFAADAPRFIRRCRATTGA